MLSGVRVLALLAVVFLCGGMQPSQADESYEDLELKEWDRANQEAVKTRKFGEYTFVPVCNSDKTAAMAYEIRRGDKVLYRSCDKKDDDEATKCFVIAPLKTNAKIKISQKYNRLTEDFIKEFGAQETPGGDITGDGIPDLITSEYTGGAHCCFSYQIFSLGKEFKHTDTIAANDAKYRFVDLDKDGICDAVGYDFIFAYWNASFADSPAPLVIASLKGGKAKLSPTLMRIKAPTDAQLQAMAKELKAGISTPPASAGKADRTLVYPDSHLWEKMLQLIYCGNGDSAWKLVDLVWPDKKKAWFGDDFKINGKKKSSITKAEFKQIFKEQLATSQYWPDVKAMNKWQ